MAKKIRFSLEMENGVEVRSIEELRENFSLDKILFYLTNGKLVTWLKDRYLNDIADAVSELDEQDTQLPRKICAVFGVEYDEKSAVDMEEMAERNRKLSLLKEYTSDKKYIDAVDSIAFDQDDLYDLLDKDATTVYLCGEKFSVPLSKKGMHYIGVDNPVVVISAKERVDFDEKGIVFENVRFDDAYQRLIDKQGEEENKSYDIVIKELEEDLLFEGGSGFCAGSPYPVLVEINKTTGDTKDIWKQDIRNGEELDFFEDADNVYFVYQVGQKLFGEAEFSIGIYHKNTSKTELSDIKLSVKRPGFPIVGSVTGKTWPKEQTICLNQNKIVHTYANKVYAMNHDGTDKTLIIEAGKDIEPVTLYKNHFYFAENTDQIQGDFRIQILKLYRCHLMNGTKECIDENATLRAYYGKFLYYCNRQSLGDDRNVWKIFEENMETSDNRLIDTISSVTNHYLTQLLVEDGYLSYINLRTKETVKVAKVDKDTGCQK